MLDPSAHPWFFCGIGGSGMLPLAQIVHGLGGTVAGSDRSYDQGRTPAKFAWLKSHGFTLFPEKGFESVTLDCINNGAKPGGRTVDVAKLQKLVKEQGFLIDGGYGKIKGTTFRLSNMGDETEATMNQLYAALDKAMAQL